MYYCTTKKYTNKYEKYFPKMQRDVGMAVPKTTETRHMDSSVQATQRTTQITPSLHLFFHFCYHGRSKRSGWTSFGRTSFATYFPIAHAQDFESRALYFVYPRAIRAATPSLTSLAACDFGDRAYTHRNSLFT